MEIKKLLFFSVYLTFGLFSDPLSNKGGCALDAQTFNINTFAGDSNQGYSGDGGPATSAELFWPWGVGADKYHNIYIADLVNNRIRIVNTSGIIITFAGNGYGAGLPNNGSYSGDGGPATAAELWAPQGVTLDSSGDAFIADVNNQRVRKVNTNGIISTLAGTGFDSAGRGGYSGDGGLATSAELDDPYAVAVDGSGSVYIDDYANERIRKVTTSGIISTFAGNGYEITGGCCIGGYSGDGGPATAAELGAPVGVAVDRSGKVYIAEFRNGRIRMVNTNGIISTFAGNGVRAYSGDGGPATSAELFDPTGVAVDGSGNVYIADGYLQRIRMVNTRGIISTIAGNGYDTMGTSGGYSGDGGPATAAELGYPNGVAVDGIGNVYIGDVDNSRIRILTNAISTGINILSIKDIQVSIFPNPNNGIFKIQWPVNSGQLSVLEIYNVLGEEVYYGMLKQVQHDYDINLSAQPNGIYFYRVLSAGGTMIGEGKVMIEK